MVATRPDAKNILFRRFATARWPSKAPAPASLRGDLDGVDIRALGVQCLT